MLGTAGAIVRILRQNQQLVSLGRVDWCRP